MYFRKSQQPPLTTGPVFSSKCDRECQLLETKEGGWPLSANEMSKDKGEFFLFSTDLTHFTLYSIIRIQVLQVTFNPYNHWCRLGYPRPQHRSQFSVNSPQITHSTQRQEGSLLKQPVFMRHRSERQNHSSRGNARQQSTRTQMGRRQGSMQAALLPVNSEQRFSRNHLYLPSIQVFECSVL